MQGSGYDVGSIGMALMAMMLNIVTEITASSIMLGVTILAGVSTFILNFIKIRKELKNEKSSSEDKAVHKDE